MFASSQSTVGCREIDRGTEEELHPRLHVGDSESTEEGPQNGIDIPVEGSRGRA